jgi:hypothetical protein
MVSGTGTLPHPGAFVEQCRHSGKIEGFNRRREGRVAKESLIKWSMTKAQAVWMDFQADFPQPV